MRLIKNKYFIKYEIKLIICLKKKLKFNAIFVFAFFIDLFLYMNGLGGHFDFNQINIIRAKRGISSGILSNIYHTDIC